MDRSTNWTHGEFSTEPGDYFRESNFSQSAPEKLVVTPLSWSTVNQDLKWLFMVHSYGFACLFSVLCFYTFFSFLNLRSLISNRPFMSTINIFLCLLGLSRSGCLFIDPYYLKQTLPKVIGSILWDIGFPFLTSAFCLIYLAFLQLTQLKLGPEKFQKESCMTLVIISHITCIMVSDIALAFHNHYITKYVVQTIFLIWSIILYVTFLYAGYKIMQLLQSMPNSMLTHDSASANQKGIMQLAALAPHCNLATSVATALMPTLISSTLGKGFSQDASKDNNAVNKESNVNTNAKEKVSKLMEVSDKSSSVVVTKPELTPMANSTVPEVYVRPPTPTPSTANLPTITVSSPRRRSSLASRRDSDVSQNSSRRSSECSMRFNNDDASAAEVAPPQPQVSRRSSELPNRMVMMRERVGQNACIPRRNSENVTSNVMMKDHRRTSDFTHEKSRSSQFNKMLRRNSDMPLQHTLEEHTRLSNIQDLSPQGSRRNSDISNLMPSKPESRRNSDVTYRRNSETSQMKPLSINRRSSDISIQVLDRSPTQAMPTFGEKDIPERSESDSDHPDYSEKVALMAEKPVEKNDDIKGRKKSLTWKNDINKDEDVTIETSLLPDKTVINNRMMSSDCMLHSVLNHIAYVNRAKTDTPLHISEASTAAARKSQIQRVLNVTYTTAILGIILCIADIVRLFGPYGILIEDVKYGTDPASSQLPKSWPWLLYQTLCRSLEFAMSCAMANITKQPSASPRHQYLNNYHNYSMRVKQRNNNLYI